MTAAETTTERKRLAQVIRMTRERRGETRLAFAQHFDVARTTVIFWECDGPPAQGIRREQIDRILVKLGGVDGKGTVDTGNGRDAA